MRGADVIVVGGGVVGCAVAYAIARERLSVVLVEADDIASGASAAAAGMLAPVSEAASPGPLLRLGLASLALFPDLVAELRERSGIDPELEQRGSLRLATSDDEARALRTRDQSLPSLALEWLDAAVARQLEPSLAPEIHGALYCPNESQVRSALLTRALAVAAVSLGAELRLGIPVRGLVREGARVSGVETGAGRIEGATTILCTGVAAAQSPAWLGQPGALPIVPVRGQILSLAPRGPAPRTVVRGATTYVVPHRDGSVAVGATEERAVFDRRATAAGVAQLLDGALRLVPSLDEAGFGGARAGLRPATPDQLPLVGAWPGVDGLVLAVGHHRSGVLLAPLTAQLVAGLVLGKGLPEEAAPLRPERFAALRARG